MRTCLVFIFILNLNYNGKSQIANTYEYIDSISYSQFINNDFNALHHTGIQALKQNIDFYYLRMRMGISYYDSKNYETALRHLNRAHEMNPTDTVAQEYLYYSLVFTGRKADAYDLAKDFSPHLQNKIGHNFLSAKYFGNIFEAIAITGGSLINNNISKNENVNFWEDARYAENTLQGNVYFGNIYLQSKITNRLRVYNNFSYFNIKSMGIVQSIFPQMKRNYSNNNFQYNLAFDYRFHNGIKVGGTFGYYKENSNYLSSAIDTLNGGLIYLDYFSDHNAYTGTLTFDYRYREFDFLLSASIGSLSDVRQLQAEAGFVYYPLGNQNFYTVSTATYLNNDNNGKFIINQKIGGKILPWLWYECAGTYGNQQNYIGSFGFSTYNTVDPILFSVGVDLRFTYKNITVIPSYTFQQRESNYLKLYSIGNTETFANKYFNHLTTTTIQWNF